DRERREVEKAKRVEDAVKEVEERVLDDADGWSSPEEGDDGGNAHRVTQSGSGGGSGGGNSGQGNTKTRRAEKFAQEQGEEEREIARQLTAPPPTEPRAMREGKAVKAGNLDGAAGVWW
ncbi:MAG: hypothetical protein M1830_006230, partial [Pleopsidium flavum]